MSEFKDLGLISEGPSGTVRKVLNTETNMIYASKLVPLDVKKEIQSQVLEELDQVYKNSGNTDTLVTFYKAYYEKPSICIILEYMDCGSLLDISKIIGQLPENILAKVTAKILKGLEYLHRKLYRIHRDIKPSNILINSRGDVKITDILMSIQLSNTIAMASTWIGAYTYMSPERIQGLKYSYNSDVWSLGITLIEAALGKYPYPNSDGKFYQLLDTIIEDPVPELPDRFSPEFKDFISLCLKKNPSERPQAQELMEHPFVTKQDNVDLSAWLKKNKLILSNKL